MTDMDYYRPTPQVSAWLLENRESLKKQVVDPALAGKSIEKALIEDVSVIKEIWREISHYADKTGASEEVKTEILTTLREGDKAKIKQIDEKNRQEILRSFKEHEDVNRNKGGSAPPPVISPEFGWRACIFCAGAAIEATGHPVIAGIACALCGYFG